MDSIITHCGKILCVCVSMRVCVCDEGHSSQKVYKSLTS